MSTHIYPIIKNAANNISSSSSSSKNSYNDGINVESNLMVVNNQGTEEAEQLNSVNTSSTSLNLTTTLANLKTKIGKKYKVPRKGKWVVVGEALNRPPDCCSQHYRSGLKL